MKKIKIDTKYIICIENKYNSVNNYIVCPIILQYVKWKHSIRKLKTYFIIELRLTISFFR